MTSSHVGKNVLLLYLLMTYGVQYLYYLFFGDILSRKYNIPDYGAFALFLNIIIVLFFLKIKIGVSNKGMLSFRFPTFAVLGFSFLFSLLALNFNLKYGLDFRHTQRVSEAGMQVMALYALKPLVLYFMMRYCFIVAKEGQLRRYERVSVGLVLIGLVLSVTGALQVLPIAFCFFILFAPSVFQADLNGRFIFKYAALALLLGFLAIFMGFANKVGFSEASGLLINNQNYIVQTILARTSSSFVSGLVLSSYSFESYGSLQAIYGIFETLVYRVEALLPFNIGLSGEYLQSINRFNYELVMKDPSLDRAGASPGLIASFLYIPFYPLPLVLLFMFVRFYIWSLDTVTNEAVAKKPVVIFFTLIVTLPMFESPLSIPTLIDPVSILFGVFFLGSFLRFRGRYE